MKVYVLAEITGEYSNTCWSVVAAAASLEKAQAVAEEDNRQWHDVKVKEIKELREKYPAAVEGYSEKTRTVRLYPGAAVTTNHVGPITAEERWPMPEYKPLTWEALAYGESPPEWHAGCNSNPDVYYEITQTELHE